MCRKKNILCIQQTHSIALGSWTFFHHHIFTINSEKKNGIFMSATCVYVRATPAHARTVYVYEVGENENEWIIKLFSSLFSPSLPFTSCNDYDSFDLQPTLSECTHIEYFLLLIPFILPIPMLLLLLFIRKINFIVLSLSIILLLKTVCLWKRLCANKWLCFKNILKGSSSLRNEC